MDDNGIGDSVIRLALGIDQARYARWWGEQGKEQAARDAFVLAQVEREQPWGLETSIDLFGCNPAAICDIPKIRSLFQVLGDLFQVHRSTEPLVMYGYEEAWKSRYLLERLTGISVTGHFFASVNIACISIFSCAGYPPYRTAACCQEWFGAHEVRAAVRFRGAKPLKHEEYTREKGRATCLPNSSPLWEA